jgi:hypothetical protein
MEVSRASCQVIADGATVLEGRRHPGGIGEEPSATALIAAHGQDVAVAGDLVAADGLLIDPQGIAEEGERHAIPALETHRLGTTARGEGAAAIEILGCRGHARDLRRDGAGLDPWRIQRRAVDTQTHAHRGVGVPQPHARIHIGIGELFARSTNALPRALDLLLDDEAVDLVASADVVTEIHISPAVTRTID